MAPADDRSSNEKSSAEMLPLGNRFAGAWQEHTTRISLRQNVVQIYLTVTGVVFGFYFSKDQPGQELKLFMMLSITIATCYIAAIAWMHNRIIQELVKFMVNCETYSKQMNSSDGLYYFLKERGDGLRYFHAIQRNLQRLALIVLIVTNNGIAVFFGWDASHGLAVTCIILLTLAVISHIADLVGDWAPVKLKQPAEPGAAPDRGDR